MFTRQANWLKIAIISPLKENGFAFNKTEFPSPKNALCQVWLKLSKWFWRRRFLFAISLFSPHGKELDILFEKT